MLSVKSVKTQAVALALAGTVALSSVLGSGVALASGPNLAPTPSFELGWSYLGWVGDAKGSDAQFGVTNQLAADGNRSVWIHADKPGNKGWPGFETKKIIPVDSNKEYTFSASYYIVGNSGLPWIDIALFDGNGKYVGSVSTGTSPAQAIPNLWHEKTYNFKPEALKKYFGDIAGVKLGLKLSLNYGVAGIERGKGGTNVVYDKVRFEEVAANGRGQDRRVRR